MGRTVTLTNVPEDFTTGLAAVGLLITIQLNLPPGLTTIPIDTNTGNPLQTAPVTLRTTSSGWTKTVVAPGDISPAGCTYTITEGTLSTQSPSFAYTGSPITVSTWYAGTNLLGRILMYVQLEQITGAPAAGNTVRITLNNTSLWTGGIGTGQLIYGNTPLPYQVNASGILSIPLIPNTDLTPSVGGCTLTTPNNYQYGFNVPSVYTNDAGSWLVGTTYALNAVVRDPTTGVPYISLTASNTGHALSDGTHWALYIGEQITNPAYFNAVSPPTSIPVPLSAILADTSVATGTYTNPPATLQDQLRQLTQIQAHHITTSTYTATYDDDVIDADGTSNTVQITLPTAVGFSKLIAVKAINIAHAVTITTTSAQTIDGAAPPLTPALHAIYVFYSDGANWQVYATNGAGGGGGSGFSRVTVSADYTMDPADTLVVVDVSGGPVTVTLPTAASNDNLIVVKTAPGTDAVHVVTVAPPSGQTLDLGTGISGSAGGYSGFLMASDGANWLMLGLY